MSELDAKFNECVEVVNNQDEDTLAGWWCRLNCFDWPDEIPHAQTEKERIEEDNLGFKVMCFIEEKIGHFKTSQWWNTKHINNMDEIEHLAWYNRTFNKSIRN